jgi:hypothetical protein
MSVPSCNRVFMLCVCGYCSCQQLAVANACLCVQMYFWLAPPAPQLPAPNSQEMQPEHSPTSSAPDCHEMQPAELAPLHAGPDTAGWRMQAAFTLQIQQIKDSLGAGNDTACALQKSSESALQVALSSFLLEHSLANPGFCHDGPEPSNVIPAEHVAYGIKTVKLSFFQKLICLGQQHELEVRSCLPLQCLCWLHCPHYAMAPIQCSSVLLSDRRRHYVLLTCASLAGVPSGLPI